PSKQRLGPDREDTPRGPGQSPAQHRQDEPVAGLPGGPLDLSPEHADLVAQHHQLDVSRPSGSAADEDEIGEQADESAEDRWEQRHLFRRGWRTLADRVRRPVAEYSYPTRSWTGRRR